MTIDIGNIIPILIVFQSVLFSLVLLTFKGEKRTSNILLSLFLLMIACQFLSILLRDAFNFRRYNGIRVVFAFAYGPLLYLYTESLIYNFFKPKIKYLIHFIPAFIALICFLLNIPTKYFMAPILYVILICYISFAIVKIVKYRRVLVNTISTTDQTNLKWLQWIMIIFTLALLLDIVDYFFIKTRIVLGISLVDLIILFLINWIFFRGLKQPKVFLGISNRKYKTSPLSKDELRLIFDQINQLFAKENVYLDPQFKVQDLSDRLQISTHKISQAINTVAGMSFFDYVNGFRVTHLKTLLSNPENRRYTILALGIESGFNSKATLNRIFKQKVRISPRAFQKQAHFTN